MKNIVAPISRGDVLDKITIFRIQAVRFKDAAKIADVRLELDCPQPVWRDSGAVIAALG